MVITLITLKKMTHYWHNEIQKEKEAFENLLAGKDRQAPKGWDRYRVRW
jgi:hypothetical protein